MPRLYLVRHGQAAAGWDADLDPGLDDVGRGQAEAMAARLAPDGPLPIVCSPLRRTRETAAPLAERWATTPTIDERVAEIPSPTDDLFERVEWLHAALAGSWSDLGPEYLAWRARLLGALAELTADTVVVTHFVAVNAVLGVAFGDDRVVVRSVANASVTVVDHDGSTMVIVDGPEEADTRVG